MRIAIIYATTDGQTRKIARFVADHLTDNGHSVELLPAADAADLDLGRFKAGILAGAVHMGGLQPALAALARTQAGALARLGTLFLCVSLSAAGTDPKDWQGLREVVASFETETGWTPGRTEHIADAFRFTQYDFFRSWAMRWIAAQKGETVDPHADKEYTDWAALSALLADWLA
jgi:menaquinone-dependent protoporphyrinogen oxidase